MVGGNVLAGVLSVRSHRISAGAFLELESLNLWGSFGDLGAVGWSNRCEGHPKASRVSS